MAKRNTVYYSESVVFQVEDELFRVQREQFEKQSEVFRDMFSLPQGTNDGGNTPNSIQEGTGDSHPVVLNGGVTKDAFSALLNVLYPRKFYDCGFYASESMFSGNSVSFAWDISPDQWASVYKLASMWLMEDIKKLAIFKVNSLAQQAKPIDKVILGRKYKREDWLLDGYRTIVETSGGISDDEVDRIGSTAAIRLLRLMLQLAKGAYGSSSYQEAFQSEICLDIRPGAARGEAFPQSDRISVQTPPSVTQSGVQTARYSGPGVRGRGRG